MIEYWSKLFFSKFNHFIVSKIETFYLFSLLTITSFEKFITIILTFLYSTILSKIKFFLCGSVSLKKFRSILILNNAKIYWNEKLIKMCEMIKIILIWLFSYFFDFNSIEILFALFKTWIKKTKNRLRHTKILINF